jgi:hypothetical protein
LLSTTFVGASEVRTVLPEQHHFEPAGEGFDRARFDFVSRRTGHGVQLNQRTEFSIAHGRGCAAWPRERERFDFGRCLLGWPSASIGVTAQKYLPGSSGAVGV